MWSVLILKRTARADKQRDVSPRHAGVAWVDVTGLLCLRKRKHAEQEGHDQYGHNSLHTDQEAYGQYGAGIGQTGRAYHLVKYLYLRWSCESLMRIKMYGLTAQMPDGQG